MLGFKKNGFFVEFGACDGKYFSNTLLMEKSFHWNGILCEPAFVWHGDLKKNRDCKIDIRCVYKETGSSIRLFESSDPAVTSIYSITSNYKVNKLRDNINHYDVETISLNDLLVFHNAPKFIDFLSIDTEGSEFEIFQNFNFNLFNFKIICVEHNYSETRNKIYNLLISNGYKRKFTLLSRFDDWYVYDL